MARLVVCVLLCVAAFVQAGHEKYEGHQLYRVSGLGDQIAELEANLDILSTKPGSKTASGKLEAVVRLSPEEKEQWLQYFDERNMAYFKMADNLADILREEESQVQVSRAAAKRSGKSIGFETYYRHDEINDYLDELAATYPDLVTVINAGLSYEGRQIKLVRISSTRFENLMKPVIVIDAMVHAREWVTTPVAIYIINQLVTEVADSPLTQDIDWIIIPLANPDGYEYTFEEDRLWRKTRSKSHPGAEECPGVDGNRNFDHYFGTSNASSNPCSIIYEGPHAFSEPEIRIIQDAVLSNLQRTSLYISLHSYGNMFLYAWGNNGTLPQNGLILHLAGVRMAAEIDKLALDKAKRYVVGNAANVLYYTTGTSRDWTKAVGIPLTYTLELPGYDYDFVVPPSYIKQIVTETWAGIAEGANYVLSIW
ncbi:carboxypeptidase B-like [Trichoplusia ni]|uniref:Carboxypeptidase B-like n=1 Tax=Trichoplusia ni TaxID=7111 RepID=A0A7E5WSF8_TRINI|nr:carboxypeptidase B-like [Trichoplusia ni]XP_026743287.1 carboxypeptidase B-like [Trichoplusia ni]